MHLIELVHFAVQNSDVMLSLVIFPGTHVRRARGHVDM